MIAWVSYDMAYRRRVANHWGVVDFTLLNKAFAGRAKSVARCKYSLSDLHQTGDCCYAPIDGGKDKGHHSQQRVISESNHWPSIQFWTLFNAKGGSQCRYKSCCKFAHLCTQCHSALSVGKGSPKLD